MYRRTKSIVDESDDDDMDVDSKLDLYAYNLELYYF